MKCQYIIFLGFFALVTSGVCRDEMGMPFILCIPASELAKKTYETGTDQMLFLRGFRNGAEMQITDPELAATYALQERQDPLGRGCKMGIAAAGERGEFYRTLHPGDFGYTSTGWKKGVFVRGPEEFSFKFDETGEKAACTFSSFAWNNWKATQKREPDYTGEIWIKGWLSPKGRFGHMGRTERKVYITEVYKYVARDSLQQNITGKD